MDAQIQVTVKLFAIYQETYGVEVLHWQFPVGTRVRDVLARMVASYPELAAWEGVTRFGVNLEFVDADTELRDGDEVVLIPPVSGG